MISGRRALVLFVTAMLSAVLAGCGAEEPTASTSSSGGSEAVPVLDPSLFDCSRASDPERTTKVPVSCATDPSCPTRLVSGHRAAGGELGVIAPENTLAAVRAAIALGADFIETDPRPTKDGVLVNMHDTSVERTTDGTGDVDQMLLSEVQALAIDKGELAGDFSCERVPTIEEVLAEAKGKIHVLLDANKTDRVDLLVEAAQKAGALDWVIFDTDSASKIDDALAKEPSLYTMIRVADQAELDSQLAHFAAHPPVIVEIHGGAAPADLAPAIHAAGNRALHDMFVTDLAAGINGDASLYAQQYDAGVDIGQTDRPDLALRYLGR